MDQGILLLGKRHITIVGGRDDGEGRGLVRDFIPDQIGSGLWRRGGSWASCLNQVARRVSKGVPRVDFVFTIVRQHRRRREWTTFRAQAMPGKSFRATARLVNRCFLAALPC